MQSLKQRWKLFLNVALDPWNLFLSLSVLTLYVLSIGQSEALTTSLLFVLITIGSAVVGGRVTKQWMDVTEGSVLMARGRSAVRSLKLLLRNIGALEARVVVFLKNEDEIAKHPEVTKRNYEEAVETCRLLAEETVSSIENWTDIIPEADIKTQIGLISELRSSVLGKEEELAELQEQLVQAKDHSEQEKNKLRTLIQTKESQIKQLTKEIFETKIGSGIGGIGTLGAIESNEPFVSVLGKRVGVEVGDEATSRIGQIAAGWDWTKRR